MTILSSFNHPVVVPNLYDFISSVEEKKMINHVCMHVLLMNIAYCVLDLIHIILNKKREKESHTNWSNMK